MACSPARSSRRSRSTTGICRRRSRIGAAGRTVIRRSYSPSTHRSWPRRSATSAGCGSRSTSPRSPTQGYRIGHARARPQRRAAGRRGDPPPAARHGLALARLRARYPPDAPVGITLDYPPDPDGGGGCRGDCGDRGCRREPDLLRPGLARSVPAKARRASAAAAVADTRGRPGADLGPDRFPGRQLLLPPLRRTRDSRATRAEETARCQGLPPGRGWSSPPTIPAHPGLVIDPEGSL